jgi:hypothetical protein
MRRRDESPAHRSSFRRLPPRVAPNRRQRRLPDRLECLTDRGDAVRMRAIPLFLSAVAAVARRRDLSPLLLDGSLASPYVDDDIHLRGDLCRLPGAVSLGLCLGARLVLNRPASTPRTAGTYLPLLPCDAAASRDKSAADRGTVTLLCFFASTLRRPAHRAPTRGALATGPPAEYDSRFARRHSRLLAVRRRGGAPEHCGILSFAASRSTT